MKKYQETLYALKTLAWQTKQKNIKRTFLLKEENFISVVSVQKKRNANYFQAVTYFLEMGCS